MLAWDRTHDWVLLRTCHDYTRVKIRFRGESPTIAELLALRRCLPRYSHTPPAELRAQLRGVGVLDLEWMHGREARHLVGVIQAAGLEAVREHGSSVSLIPFDRTTGCGWLIDDEARGRAVVEAMIAAGVPIQHVEA